MLSRSANLAMVAYSPDSSVRFHRNARASALTNVLSARRGWLAPSASCISFRPPRFTIQNGSCSVTISATVIPTDSEIRQQVPKSAPTAIFGPDSPEEKSAQTIDFI